MEFKGTKNWRLRELSDGNKFIEADLPDPKHHFPRIEVGMEDYGDHNGYTEKLRNADITLQSKAPEMLEMLENVLHEYRVNRNTSESDLGYSIEQLIKEATTV